MTPPILVVEDDADCRALLTTMLECEGERVITAANGADGIRLAKSHQPFLILLDLMMPVMDGEGFRRTQLADPDIRQIPVCVTSARHDASAIAKRLEAVACVDKPIDIATMMGIVRRHRHTRQG